MKPIHPCETCYDPIGLQGQSEILQIIEGDVQAGLRDIADAEGHAETAQQSLQHLKGMERDLAESLHAGAVSEGERVGRFGRRICELITNAADAASKIECASRVNRSHCPRLEFMDIYADRVVRLRDELVHGSEEPGE